MTEHLYNVLFLWTGNSARSIIAEAWLNVKGRGRFRAFSAGSHPTGSVNPFALREVELLGYDQGELRSKSWDEFAAIGAPQMDFVITVCDQAAGEICPVWPGQPITAHWGFPDPAKVEGVDETKRRAFSRVARELATRIQLFTSLPLATLVRLMLEAQVRALGGTPPTRPE